MNDSAIQLQSVNWEHGMLLTPDHFIRQERYFDSALLWATRYLSDADGLIGGGPRVSEEERGARKFDPIITITEDEDLLHVSVSQCRGVTPSGLAIQIDPSEVLRAKFAKSDLEGVSSTNLFIVCPIHRKVAVDGPADEYNPQLQTARRQTYVLALNVPADQIADALVVGRVRRAREAAAFENSGDFIPPCTNMAACSQLMAEWRDITSEVYSLFTRCSNLHRAMQQFILLFEERGLKTETDRESVAFDGRMVVALQTCLHDTLNPMQSPVMFFAHLYRFLHGAAVYLDLSPAVRQFYEMLKTAGETEYLSLVEQQNVRMNETPKWNGNRDLATEARLGRAGLATLNRLERALEGKYIDFRVSRSIDAMNFVFDQGTDDGEPRLYRLASKPSRVQAQGGELTIVFAPLKLEGREKYRLILAGEPDAVFRVGTQISVDIRINQGSGFNRPPIYLTRNTSQTEQCNLEFDFDAPDVPTITDLRVTIAGHVPVRTGLLFVRERFFASKSPEFAKAATARGTVIDTPGSNARPNSAPQPPQPSMSRPTPPRPYGSERAEPRPPEPPPRRRRFE